MMRRVTACFWPVIFAVLLAAPASAQRNRDRDRDRDRDQRPARNRERRPDAVPGAGRHGSPEDLLGPGDHHRRPAAARSSSRPSAARRRERLDDIKLEITQNGNVVEIDANHRLVERRNDNVVETDFDIQVPSQTKLDLRTFSAPITVTGVAGDMTVDGFSSEIRLDRRRRPDARQDVQRPVQRCRRHEWADGDDLNVDTFSGDVTLRLPDTARGDINFDSFSGTFNSDLPVTMSSSSRRNFRGSLNGGGNTDFRLKTFSGSNVAISSQRQ